MYKIGDKFKSESTGDINMLASVGVNEVMMIIIDGDCGKRSSSKLKVGNMYHISTSEIEQGCPFFWEMTEWIK